MWCVCVFCARAALIYGGCGREHALAQEVVGLTHPRGGAPAPQKQKQGPAKEKQRRVATRTRESERALFFYTRRNALYRPAALRPNTTMPAWVAACACASA